MKNFPFWPAKIVNPPAVKEKVSPTTKGPQKKKPSTYRKAQHYVFFFGSQNYAWISHENIVPHSEEMLNKPIKKKSGSYAKAIEEIVEASLAVVPKPKDEKKDNVENGDFCKITEIPPIKEDEFCKKPRLRIVRRDRPTKQQNDGEEMEKSSQKRNLPEEPTEELSQKKCQVSLPPDILSNTDNPATVIQPLVDQSRAAPECSELPPRPSLDLSKPTIPLKEYMKPTSKKIGFIGLGMMGQRIVKNLLHSGHDVSVWNRTPEKCKKFVDAGAKHLSTPADIVQNCDIIFCCISEPHASKSLVFGKCGILEGLEKCRFGTKEYVEMTSIDSRTSQGIAEVISQRGGKYLEAPIIGSLSAAEEGTLLIISAGNHDVFNSCETCFFAISKNSLYLSADVGNASNMNLIHSMLMSTSNAVMAEQMAVIDRHNIPKVKLLEVIQLDPIGCPLFSESGQAIVDQNFVTNTSLKYQQQNLNMALQLGSSFAQPLRLASAANELYKSAESLGYSEHDMSAVYIGARR
ncbi:putative oxidoreductase GLYR1 homolog [Trichonephila clavata]|uniref:Cytokine-like nuclear factor N-PAC n=1 Tax=Trichonephila clavata TaxID=2740835 RepID=A0A8X6GJ96_TRICU|nr:putative oxidoreductase GLYR1 homolog [Trichonephila clavata]